MPRMNLDRFTDRCEHDDAPRPAVRPVSPEVIRYYLTPEAIRRGCELVVSPEYEAWKAEQANGHRDR